MNRITLSGWLLSFALAQGQGVVNFNNSPSAVGNGGAPVSHFDGTRLSGTAWLAQLYAGPDTTNLVAVGEPLAFRTGAGAGFLNTTGKVTVRTIPNVAPGEVAVTKIVVWSVASGASWLSADQSGLWGWSPTLLVVTGDPAEPAPDLIGLQPFVLAMPSVWDTGGQLTLSRAGSFVILQWDYLLGPTKLEWASVSSSEATWTREAGDIFPTQGKWTARVDSTAGARFFRLHHQADWLLFPPLQVSRTFGVRPEEVAQSEVLNRSVCVQGCP